MKRLISFVGTGKYDPTCYQLDSNRSCQTEYIAEALARIFEVDEVRLLATRGAREVHGEALQQRLTQAGITSRLIDYPDGRDESELWGQFNILREQLLTAAEDEILFDITHGFRSQPFFAGAALAVARATCSQPPSVRIYYGEWQKGVETAPIRDISVFLEVIDWSQALGLFLQTGVAAPSVVLGKRSEELHRRQQLAQGGREWPKFGKLVNALGAFSDDLAAVRIAALITGFDQTRQKRCTVPGSAQCLLVAIEQFRVEVVEKLPPLAGILDQIAEMARPLVSHTLSGAQGQQAMAALAQLYLRLGRLPEAAICLREGRVSSISSEQAETEVKHPAFNHAKRESLDKRWRDEDPDARTIGQIRNDIEHGGFQTQPRAAADLRSQLDLWIRAYAESAQASIGESQAIESGTHWFVSRHPGAVEWIERQGVRIDQVVPHLDLSQVKRGDRVYGTLPANLGARVCERGAEYHHLSIEMPAEARGQELTAELLQEYGACLQQYRITPVK